MNEADEETLARLNRAVAAFRRYWWGLLAARPDGFPWLTVAGNELTGITVVDLDATLVLAGSEDKQDAAATYKGVGCQKSAWACDLG